MEASLIEVLVMFVDSLFNEDGVREITLGIITDLILIIFAFRTYTPATWRDSSKKILMWLLYLSPLCLRRKDSVDQYDQ